jgi:hypothetical protein
VPHTLRRVDVGEEAPAELEVLVGFDDDLAGEATRLSNRLSGLLTQVHPALERVLGPRVSQKATLALIAEFGCPTRMRAAAQRRPDLHSPTSLRRPALLKNRTTYQPRLPAAA